MHVGRGRRRRLSGLSRRRRRGIRSAGGKDSLGSRVSKLYTCAAGSRSPVTRVDEVRA